MWNQNIVGLRGPGAELVAGDAAVPVTCWKALTGCATNAGMSAYVYTQLTDVESESNGLLTYDRAVLKLDAADRCGGESGRVPAVAAEPDAGFSAHRAGGAAGVAVYEGAPAGGLGSAGVRRPRVGGDRGADRRRENAGRHRRTMDAADGDVAGVAAGASRFPHLSQRRGGGVSERRAGRDDAEPAERLCADRRCGRRRGRRCVRARRT